MTTDEYLLVNECRKKILNEINLILNEIVIQKNNDFNFLTKTDELYPKNVPIYKLEKDCHVTTSTPANEFTQKFYESELKKIEDALD